MARQPKPIRLGGVRGTHSRGARRPWSAPYQPQGDAAAPYALRIEGAAVTADLGLRSLPAATLVNDGITPGAMLAAPAGLIVHDTAAQALLLDPHTETPSTLVSGLADAPVSLHEHQGFVWWSDGVTLGRIAPDGTARPGTLPETAAPTVTATTGSLPQGDYLVAITWVDDYGMESACGALAQVTLEDTGGLQVAVGAVPAEAAAVRLYCSQANGQQARLVGDYALGAWPVTVSTVPTSKAVLRTAGLSLLPAGAGLTSRGGFLLAWIDDVLFHSRGDFTALCDLSRDLHQFPGAILGAVGVEQGVWVATSAGLYWLAGRDLTQAAVSARQDTRTYAAGAALVPPEMTGLETGWPCACFASDEGPVFGTADGQLVAPYADSQRWGVTNKHASIAVWEFAETKQLMVSLT
jgi:hypothetical protein